MIRYLDSNICIDCMRDKTPVFRRELQKLLPSQVKIPSMVKAELLHGALRSANPSRNQELVMQLLAPFEVVSFDDAAAREYTSIRLQLEQVGAIIGFNDLVIAATVKSLGGILVTNSIKEFNRVEGLFLESWAEVSL